MKVKIEKIGREKEEQVLISCYEINQKVEEIARFAKSYQEGIEAYDEQGVRSVAVSDIYYIEAVDQRVFAYLNKNVYEIKMRLYEFEEKYRELHFLRCSKASIVNLMKIKSLKPALNGRFSAMLINGETVIIARKYVPDLKAKLHGGK
ncbi:LytTR family DNA-binding domain-containing protein [Konateibacter massiliensis]|uniref:LytTR family DNA-binding domain-containing protein n=1 Tax=Konateibacter massiliensis TaxID=2002841 RepID=UPI000C149E9B|nr:LytTR family DNA-binding domain-containing protein [Konateibacter massiliensis]